MIVDEDTYTYVYCTNCDHYKEQLMCGQRKDNNQNCNACSCDGCDCFYPEDCVAFRYRPNYKGL